MKILFIFIIVTFLPFKVKAQNFQAPSIPSMNSQQSPMMNTFMFNSYQRSDETLLDIEEKRVEKIKSKLERKTFELDSLKIKQVEITKNISNQNDNEIEKTIRKIENKEKNIEDLKLKLLQSNQLISDLKLNIETTNIKKEEKAKAKLERKNARAKKEKKINNTDYEDND